MPTLLFVLGAVLGTLLGTWLLLILGIVGAMGLLLALRRLQRMAR